MERRVVVEADRAGPRRGGHRRHVAILTREHLVAAHARRGVEPHFAHIQQAVRVRVSADIQWGKVVRRVPRCARVVADGAHGQWRASSVGEQVGPRHVRSHGERAARSHVGVFRHGRVERVRRVDRFLDPHLTRHVAKVIARFGVAGRLAAQGRRSHTCDVAILALRRRIRPHSRRRVEPHFAHIEQRIAVRIARDQSGREVVRRVGRRPGVVEERLHPERHAAFVDQQIRPDHARPHRQRPTQRLIGVFSHRWMQRIHRVGRLLHMQPQRVAHGSPGVEGRVVVADRQRARTADRFRDHGREVRVLSGYNAVGTHSRRGEEPHFARIEQAVSVVAGNVERREVIRQVADGSGVVTD